MPNRTVYLPDELDEVSRRLKLNLSRVVQQAIRDLASELSPSDVDAKVRAASSRAQDLDIDWSEFSLEESRDIAQER